MRNTPVRRVGSVLTGERGVFQQDKGECSDRGAGSTVAGERGVF